MAMLQGPAGGGGGEEPPPWRKALPPIDWKGNYEEEEEEELDLRYCKKCHKVSYLRKGACCNPKCVTLLACSSASHFTGRFLPTYLMQELHGRDSSVDLCMFCSCVLWLLCSNHFSAQVLYYMNQVDWVPHQKGSKEKQKVWKPEEWKAWW